MRKGVQNERLDTNSNYCYQSLTARLLADADYVNMYVNICVLDYKTKFNEVLATN